MMRCNDCCTGSQRMPSKQWQWQQQHTGIPDHHARIIPAGINESRRRANGGREWDLCHPAAVGCDSQTDQCQSRIRFQKYLKEFPPLR